MGVPSEKSKTRLSSLLSTKSSTGCSVPGNLPDHRVLEFPEPSRSVTRMRVRLSCFKDVKRLPSRVALNPGTDLARNVPRCQMSSRVMLAVCAWVGAVPAKTPMDNKAALNGPEKQRGNRKAISRKAMIVFISNTSSQISGK